MSSTNVTPARNRFAAHALIAAIPVTILSFLIAAPGCRDDPDPPANDTAQGPAYPDTAGIPAFSGERAYEMVERQVTFGPRNPGSEGAARALDFLVEELGTYAATVERQEFTHVGYEGKELRMTNVIATFNPEATTRILLCAHWDTRPRSDEDSDPADREKPIVGANDGGSGVGVLLEFARILKENPPPIGVDIVLFDGEDYGDSDVDELDRYFLGAKHFAKSIPSAYRPAFGILLDIVGDHEAEFGMEDTSVQYAGSIVRLVWGAAEHLGLKTFAQKRVPGVSDDHLPLNQIARIPTIDIIDASLVGHNDPEPRRQYWHTSDDDMKNISAETLGEVGRLLSYIVYRVVPDQMKKDGGAV